VSSWVNFERKVEREFNGLTVAWLTFTGEVKSVLPKDEPLTPGILYVGVAGLAGSVFARNRE
jgi:organizing structure protein 2